MRTRYRTVCALVLPVLWLATFAVGPLVVSARANDEGFSKAVARLKRLSEDPQASWVERWRAYNDVKEPLEEAEEAIKAAEDEEAKQQLQAAYDENKAAYEDIKGIVAGGLRRTTLPLGGWIMGFLAASLLWGGFAVCVTIAVRSQRAGSVVVQDED